MRRLDAFYPNVERIKAEADGGCREFGSSGVDRVGRPLVILHTLIMLGLAHIFHVAG